MNLNWLKTAFLSQNKQVRSGEPSRRPHAFRPRVVELEDRRLLASFYVDSTVGFGSTASSTFNKNNYGEVPGVDQAHAFVTLGGALASNILVSGDTIFIAKGTYPLLANTTISKSLGLVGSVNSAADATPVTTLIPGSDTPNGTGPGSGWITVVLNNNLNVSNLTVDGMSNAVTPLIPRQIAQAIRYESTGTSTINNVRFQNIGGTFAQPFGKYSGEAITDLAGVVNVSNSSFTNMGREGIVYSGPTASGTVLNITYTGKGVGDFIDYAVEVNGAANATVTASYITFNQGISLSDGSASAGLFVSDPSSTLNAFGNLLQNNEDAFIDGVGTNVTADTSILNAQYNNVLNNTFAVESNVVTGAVFTNNYFGSVNAPASTLFSDGQTATNAGSFLFHKTWVWNGTSAANYLANTSFFAAGNSLGDINTSATLRVYDGTGTNANVLGRAVTNNNTDGILSTNPFGVGYKGGISVSIGDWNNDYRPDVAISNTEGDVNTNVTVAIFDVATGANIGNFFAFNIGFNGGAYVRLADINGDGTDEVILGKGADVTGRPNNGNPAGSQVQVYGNSGSPGAPTLVTSLVSIYGIPSAIHVGAGDLNKDGKYEIITAPASDPKGGKLDDIRVFNFSAGTTPNNAGTIPPPPVGSFAPVGGFSAFGGSAPNGVGLNVDGGSVDGSGYDQIIVANDFGVAPAHVETFSYAAALGSFAAAPVIQDSYFAYGPGTPDAAFAGGVTVTAARVRGTAFSDVITGVGPNTFSQFNGTKVTTPRSSGNGDIRVFTYHPVKTGDFGIPTIKDFSIFGGLLAGIQVGG